METKSEEYQCQVCPKSYKKVTELLKHLKVHMGVKSHIPKEIIQQAPLDISHIEIKLEPEEIRSYILGKEDKDEKSLVRITKGKTKKDRQNVKVKRNKSHECNSCDKNFIWRSSLQRHVKSVHNKINDHKCELCNKSFGEKNKLIRHFKSVHDKVRNFKCNIKHNFANW